MKVRKTYLSIEEIMIGPSGAAERPLIKVAAAAVVDNPYAGRYVEDLSEMVDFSLSLGEELGRKAVQALGGEKVESYGKGAIVGVNGEQEHGVAFLTTAFGDALRNAVGGGEAWISSATKCGESGSRLDIPLAHKDVLYVRSHYDAVEVSVPDAPLPNEILIVCVVANQGRLDERLGGVKASEIVGEDGLR